MSEITNRRASFICGLAAASAALALASPAMARDLTAADLQRIEHINQEQNAKLYSARLRASDGPCSIYAVNKASALLQAGYGPGEVVIAIVTTELGELHAVAEVKGTLRGKPITIVLDSRDDWTASRTDLEQIGYTWNAEFAR